WEWRALAPPPNPLPETERGNKSLPLIPVYPHVLGRPADGDDVRLAVAVQVGHGQVLDRDAPVVKDHPLPLLADGVGALVNAHAALLGERVPLRRIVANADDETVTTTAIQVGTPDGMAPAEMVVENLAIVRLATLANLVDNDLVAVPR